MLIFKSTSNDLNADARSETFTQMNTGPPHKASIIFDNDA